MSPLACCPPLDELIWLRLVEGVLGSVGTCVAACDDERNILRGTSSALQLIEQFSSGKNSGRLPPSLQHGVEYYLEQLESAPRGRPVRPVRVESDDQSVAVLLAGMPVHDLAPVTLVIWFHREILRDTDLLDALRKRYAISARQFQVISLLRMGFSNNQIAHSLGVTETAIKHYLHDVFEELDVRSRAELVLLVEQIRTGHHEPPQKA